MSQSAADSAASSGVLARRRKPSWRREGIRWFFTLGLIGFCLGLELGEYPRICTISLLSPFNNPVNMPWRHALVGLCWGALAGLVFGVVNYLFNTRCRSVKLQGAIYGVVAGALLAGSRVVILNSANDGAVVERSRQLRLDEDWNPDAAYQKALSEAILRQATYGAVVGLLLGLVYGAVGDSRRKSGDNSTSDPARASSDGRCPLR